MSSDDTRLGDDLDADGIGPEGSSVVRPAGSALPPPSIDQDTVTGGIDPDAVRPAGGQVDPDAPTLIGISFDRPITAQEFLVAMTRLKQDGQLDLTDAVVVNKDADGSTKVVETIDPTPGKAAFSGAMWTGLLGLVLGGPVGWLAGLGVGAGAGAVTAKIVDLGVPDEWVDWFKAAVRPGTSTVVLLAESLDVRALEREATRFVGAEVVYSTLPNAVVDDLRDAFGDHTGHSAGDEPR